MPEKCISDPSRECRSSARLAVLEKRVDNLEIGQQKEAEFRKTFYADREARIERDAHMDEKISSIDEKLDTVTGWVETQKTRPAKRWEGLIDKIIWAVAGAFLVWLVSGMPGIGA